MKLTTLWTAILAIALASAAHAAQYSDADANFRLTVPDGWQSAKVVNEYLKLMMVKGTDKETFGICTVVTQKHPEMQQMTQAQIDAQMGPLIDEKFWQFALTMSPGLDDASVKSARTDVRGGRNVYTAEMSLKLKNKTNGATLDASAKEIMLAIPGQFYFVACLAPDTGYAALEEDIDTVLTSFEPLTDAVVAQNDAGVSALTLYSDAKFGGVSRVVTKDTPDLTVYGWSKPAGSVSVSGGAPWEMCTGTNYAGNCQVVTGAFLSDPGRGGAVLSARRLNPREPATLARSLQSDAARALGETVLRAH
ncbi:MAG: hypothetical protein GC190_21730 [Alphaproteobacteria bacterium]|nr:hypothetical protein [Alphaproteobacteria bacterium]